MVVKIFSLAIGLLFAISVAADSLVTIDGKKSEFSLEIDSNLLLAEPCNEGNCQLPNCRCASTTLGEKFEGNETSIPQLVTVTFDDAITALNYEQVQEALADLTNPNGCPVRATFFVSHEYTDYTRVHALYEQGHEIALHSVTHGHGTDYWRQADENLLLREFGQQIEILETFAKVNRSHVRGMRTPFLQIAGNANFAAAKKLNLLYDSSWPTQTFIDPPLWPYTLDYHSIQDCQIGVCPDASIPGMWVNPMVSWRDKQGYVCAMLDACIYMPNDEVDQIFDWMMENFERHYNSNRAPFGVYLHSAWFQRGQNYLKAFKRFLSHISQYPDVYMVTASQVIDYMKNPKLDAPPYEGCPEIVEKSVCKPKRCQLKKAPMGEERWLNVCNKCPEVYPWLDNPFGLRKN